MYTRKQTVKRNESKLQEHHDWLFCQVKTEMKIRSVTEYVSHKIKTQKMCHRYTYIQKHT